MLNSGWQAVTVPLKFQDPGPRDRRTDFVGFTIVTVTGYGLPVATSAMPGCRCRRRADHDLTMHAGPGDSIWTIRVIVRLHWHLEVQVADRLRVRAYGPGVLAATAGWLPLNCLVQVALGGPSARVGGQGCHWARVNKEYYGVVLKVAPWLPVTR
jgi:hypothetical protein